MLEQSGNALPFLAFFTESKLGKTGLTVTVDVYEDSTLILSEQSATEVGGGLYFYQLPAINVDANALYSVVFKTATTTVDLQHVPALWVVGRGWVNDVDEAISSRSSHSAADVWTSPTRTLTDYGTLVADIWNNTVRTLTDSGSTITPEEIWTYATRTITGLSITPQDLLDSLSETVVNIRRGDTYVQSFNSPEVLSGYTSLWFTIKGNATRSEPDSAAIIQIKKNSAGGSDGLLYVNGSPAGDASLGSITVSGDVITVEIHQSITEDFTPVMNKPIDIQMLKDGDVKTLVDGSARIYGDVTRSLS